MSNDELDARAKYAILWRLGLDSEQDHNEDLVEIRGTFPEFMVVTRKDTLEGFDALASHDDAQIVDVRINVYNGLTVTVLCGENTV